MKHLLLVLCLFATSACFAQRLEKDEVDRFTKLQTKETNFNHLWRDVLFGGLIEAGARNVEHRTILHLKLHFTSIFSIYKGDKLFLLLENDNSIPLKAISSQVADYYGKMWHAIIAYEVPDENLKELTTVGVKEIRIDESHAYDTYKIKDKHKMVIANCLKLVTE